MKAAIIRYFSCGRRIEARTTHTAPQKARLLLINNDF
jgi:hypothetical protein